MRFKISLSQQSACQFANSQFLRFSFYFPLSSSSLVVKILKDAHNAGKKFRVVVVDSRPKFEGKLCFFFVAVKPYKPVETNFKHLRRRILGVLR